MSLDTALQLTRVSLQQRQDPLIAQWASSLVESLNDWVLELETQRQRNDLWKSQVDDPSELMNTIEEALQLFDDSLEAGEPYWSSNTVEIARVIQVAMQELLRLSKIQDTEVKGLLLKLRALNWPLGDTRPLQHCVPAIRAEDVTSPSFLAWVTSLARHVFDSTMRVQVAASDAARSVTAKALRDAASSLDGTIDTSLGESLDLKNTVEGLCAALEDELSGPAYEDFKEQFLSHLRDGMRGLESEISSELAFRAEFAEMCQGFVRELRCKRPRLFFVLDCQSLDQCPVATVLAGPPSTHQFSSTLKAYCCCVAGDGGLRLAGTEQENALSSWLLSTMTSQGTKLSCTGRLEISITFPERQWTAVEELTAAMRTFTQSQVEVTVHCQLEPCWVDEEWKFCLQIRFAVPSSYCMLPEWLKTGTASGPQRREAAQAIVSEILALGLWDQNLPNVSLASQWFPSPTSVFVCNSDPLRVILLPRQLKGLRSERPFEYRSVLGQLGVILQLLAVGSEPTLSSEAVLAEALLGCALPGSGSSAKLPSFKSILRHLKSEDGVTPPRTPYEFPKSVPEVQRDTTPVALRPKTPNRQRVFSPKATSAVKLVKENRMSPVPSTMLEIPNIQLPNGTLLYQKWENALLRLDHCGITKKQFRVERLSQIQNTALEHMFNSKLIEMRLRTELSSAAISGGTLPMGADAVGDSLRSCMPEMFSHSNGSDRTVCLVEGPVTAPEHCAWLLHGTSSQCAAIIASEGFDERVSNTNGIFGAGLYFANTLCKAHKYTEPKLERGSGRAFHTVILCNVALGNYFTTDKPMRTIRRAPEHTQGRPYDSVVGNGRSHQEFVVYDRYLVYPSFVVEYSLSTS